MAQLCHFRRWVVSLMAQLCHSRRRAVSLMAQLCHYQRWVVSLMAQLCHYRRWVVSLMAQLCHYRRSAVRLMAQLCHYRRSAVSLMAQLCHSRRKAVSLMAQLCHSHCKNTQHTLSTQAAGWAPASVQILWFREKPLPWQMLNWDSIIQPTALSLCWPRYPTSQFKVMCLYYCSEVWKTPWYYFFPLSQFHIHL